VQQVHQGFLLRRRLGRPQVTIRSARRCSRRVWCDAGRFGHGPAQGSRTARPTTPGWSRPPMPTGAISRFDQAPCGEGLQRLLHRVTGQPGHRGQVEAALRTFTTTVAGAPAGVAGGEDDPPTPGRLTPSRPMARTTACGRGPPRRAAPRRAAEQQHPHPVGGRVPRGKRRYTSPRRCTFKSAKPPGGNALPDADAMELGKGSVWWTTNVFPDSGLTTGMAGRRGMSRNGRLADIPSPAGTRSSPSLCRDHPVPRARLTSARAVRDLCRPVRG